MLSLLAALALFGERPGGLAIVGALTVLAGIMVVIAGGWSSRGREAWTGMRYGRQVLIAGYTLWDANAVKGWALDPVWSSRSPSRCSRSCSRRVRSSAGTGCRR